jgi:Holliday junction resolvase-like predicted endonuclease
MGMLVEVWTRTARDDQSGLSGVSATAEKQHVVGRTARRFLMERRVTEPMWSRSKNSPAKH